jgi:rod shape-determining protein MreC
MPKRRSLLPLLIGLILFSLSRTGVLREEMMKGFSLSLLFPFQKAFSYFHREIRSLFEDYVFLLNVKEENKRLKRELEQLKMENVLLREEKREAERLRRLLELKEAIKFKVIVARLIGESPDPQSRTFYIDKGSLEGIKKGMAVITPDGIVGKVLFTGPKSSLILPIIERGASLSVMLEDSGTRGILEGQGERCLLRYLPPEEPIREGERVLTTGLDGVYPKGFPVGYIRRIIKKSGALFLEAEVEPSVRFERLEEVMVIREG